MALRQTKKQRLTEVPIIESSYRAPFPFRGPHLTTILAKLVRAVKPLKYIRKRISTPDNDFIDLDFVKNNHTRIAVLVHGLEGCSDSTYMVGMATELGLKGFDTVCVNMRGCSGEINKSFGSYHSGKTDDLRLVIDYVSKDYSEIIIIGFSLGGNQVLKYLGESGNSLSEKIKIGIAVSTPCDLEGSAMELKKLKNKIYLQRFLKSMKSKANQKKAQHPSKKLDIEAINVAKNFHEFDNLFTAPVHGFLDAKDYWKKSSSKQFVSQINIPTLLVNAKNDSFLSVSCYPIREAKNNPNFFLEMPKKGGHLGFLTWPALKGVSWLESRVMDFIIEKFP